MFLDGLATSLTRSWFLFEVVQTYAIEQVELKAIFHGLFLCTGADVMNRGDVLMDLGRHVVRRLAFLRLEYAEATDDTEKNVINQVVSDKGGFPKMNVFVQNKVRKALKAMENTFIQDPREIKDTVILKLCEPQA